MSTKAIVSTRTVDFRETLQPATGVDVRRPVPITGRIERILIHWPAGCFNLVDVAIIHEDGGAGGRKTGILPTDVGTYLALDPSPPPFDVHFPVKKGDYILAVMHNTDGVNPHTISIDCIIVPTVMILHG